MKQQNEQPDRFYDIFWYTGHSKAVAIINCARQYVDLRLPDRTGCLVLYITIAYWVVTLGLGDEEYPTGPLALQLLRTLKGEPYNALDAAQTLEEIQRLPPGEPCLIRYLELAYQVEVSPRIVRLHRVEYLWLMIPSISPSRLFHSLCDCGRTRILLYTRTRAPMLDQT
jgi:hypothetical protein